LQKILKPGRSRLKAKVFLGGSVPENLTGAIRRFRPTHLLIIDAADMGRPPGAMALIDPEQAGGNLTASTHALPMGVLAGYLRGSVGCEVIIIGIQPATRGYGAEPSEQVAQAAKKLAGRIAAMSQSQGGLTRPARPRRKGAGHTARP
jgi:hydrogenase 3 maturation protease